MPLVSVVIPIYNAKDYLNVCLGSVLKQRYENIEIILVDDGSIDDSLRICEEYADKYSNIRILEKANGGASSARNLGMSMAKGKYLIFVDGDDYWIGDDFLMEFVDILETNPNADFIGFNYKYDYHLINKCIEAKRYSVTYPAVCSKKEMLHHLLNDGLFPVSPCTKIFRLSFLVNNHIFFKEGTVAEDIPWFLKILEKTSNFILLNRFCYAYRKQVISSASSGSRLFFNLLELVKAESDRLRDSCECIYKNEFLSFIAYEYTILLALSYNLKEPGKSAIKVMLQKYSWLLKYDLNSKVRKVRLLVSILGLNLSCLILGIYVDRYVLRK